MIIFFGIAGSGKGTQAETLGKRLKCTVLSSGELLRQNANNRQIKAKIDAGDLVGDELLLPLLDKELTKRGSSEFILDGTPRNVNQARWLVDKIKQSQVKLTAIIHINLSKETALARLRLRGRHDDDEEAIDSRFKFYENSVVPAMKYFKDQGFAIHEVDGNQPIEEVAKQIQEALKV